MLAKNYLVRKNKYVAGDVFFSDGSPCIISVVQDRTSPLYGEFAAVLQFGTSKLGVSKRIFSQETLDAQGAENFGFNIYTGEPLSADISLNVDPGDVFYHKLEKYFLLISEGEISEETKKALINEEYIYVGSIMEEEDDE